MPEGDTIHAVARALKPELVGRRLTLLEAHQRPVPWGPGALVTACEAVGKHLYVHFETALGQRFVRVHLGMKGSWHRYRPAEAWQRNPNSRRLVLATSDWLFVCFGPKEVEVGLRPKASHLGPDLLAAEPHIYYMSEIVARARRVELDLGDLLLTQTVACGIGNVYKSETLFLERLDPWRATASVSDVQLVAIYQRAQALMRENLERGGWRMTTPRSGAAGDRVHGGQRYWVYRRANRPCRRCGRPVSSRLQGLMARMTYWCPGCQT